MKSWERRFILYDHIGKKGQQRFSKPLKSSLGAWSKIKVKTKQKKAKDVQS